MAIPASLRRNLVLPVIGAPMFIVSCPDLVIAQCTSGVIGAFPALNARTEGQLNDWLAQIESALATAPHSAIFAVNQIIHPTNKRLEQDVALCIQHEVPLIITSLAAPARIVPQVQAYGGLVFHDVISLRHAKKALDAGVDGLILVCAGAGGHAGPLSPFAFVAEVRKFYDGPIALSGAINNGKAILAAQAMGADFAYIGTHFIATHEANANDRYKQAILDSTAADILYTPYFTGVHGNYLKKSILDAGLDPDNLPQASSFAEKAAEMLRTTGDGIKAWRDIWGAGQGVGGCDGVCSVSDVVARLRAEYRDARTALCAS